MERLNASAAREEFAELLNQEAYQGEQIILHRRGKNVAALVPLEDLELIQAKFRQQQINSYAITIG